MCNAIVSQIRRLIILIINMPLHWNDQLVTSIGTRVAHCQSSVRKKIFHRFDDTNQHCIVLSLVKISKKHIQCDPLYFMQINISYSDVLRWMHIMVTSGIFWQTNRYPYPRLIIWLTGWTGNWLSYLISQLEVISVSAVMSMHTSLRLQYFCCVIHFHGELADNFIDV